ncbi:MAG: hypothetical protein ABSF29_03655 [Tepidisphaeraceae bacterium]
MFNLKRVGAVNMLAALTLVTACEQSGRNYAANFDPPVESQQRQALIDAQTNAGARADATLYADHFDATGLSSLGTDKLNKMMADSHSKNPMVVYLDVPNDASAAARQTAVSHYLMDHGGLKAGQFQVALGANPETFAPTDNDIKNYDKTDTAGDISGGSGGSSSSGH